MSQFLICDSIYNLSSIGKKLEDIEQNKKLYEKVVKRYCSDSKHIWVIEKIHEMVDDIELNIDTIYEIARKSKQMIFWYGSDYEDLDNVYSGDELIEILKKYFNTSCVELYLNVCLKNEKSFCSQE